MSYLDLTDEWILELQALFAIITEELEFKPSAVSLREQRAREQADRTIKAFSERFTEKGFFPDDDKWLVFALLPQLAEWPVDLSLRLVDEQNEPIASWNKGTDDSVIKRSVILMQKNNGDYAAPGNGAQSINDPEALFQLILRLLPAGLRLTGSFFPNTAEEIVSLREQIAALVRSNRAQVFDALLADDADIKSSSGDRFPNPFLPFWQTQPTDRSPALNRLLALNPEISPARFEALLEQVPLSDAQSRAFVDDGELPEPFIGALQESVEEWSKDKGLDGLFHSRTYSPDADVLAQEFGATLLKERFDHELIITEPWQADYEPSGPDDTAIVLKHDGYGIYRLRDPQNGEVTQFDASPDSFYQAIGYALQPHERLALGMQSAADVAGLRTTVGNFAAAANGGWFDPQNAIEVKDDLLPLWLKNASMADKQAWNLALEDYRQALVEAQSPDFPDIEQYGSPERLRSYAKAEIERRLRAEVGVTTSADDIIVVTTESTWTGSGEPPPDLVFGGSQQESGGEWEYSHTQRSLTQLCLENLRLEDSAFWLTARFLDRNGHPITALGKIYVYGLVRDLNVGDSYAHFLRQKLLTSDFGRWSRDCYAQVMAAQMRLDAVEAKMAGDLRDRTDRGYQWVRAVVDHPVDDDERPLVEGHRIQVQTLVLDYTPPQDRPLVVHGEVLVSGIPVEGLGRAEGVMLEGVLMIAPESRLSVPGGVVYTPSSPGGINFRQFSSHTELETQLLDNPDFWDYLESRVAVERRTELRAVLNDTNDRKFLRIKAQTALTTDFYVTRYEAEVEHVIAQIDAQTTSNSEANWSSAWNIASTLGELALEFAPFKVALPIAAARSLYAVIQGVGALGKGDSNASVHLTQAVLLLTDGLPGVKKTKVRPSISPNLDPKYAMRTTPDGLQLRTDGRFNGVYEKVHADGSSSFYAKNSNDVFAIRYDKSLGRWQVFDSRNPRSGLQMLIEFGLEGRWVHAPLGRGGGKGEKKALKAKKAAQEAAARGEPDPSTYTKGVPSATGRLTLNMDGFFESKEFLDAQARITVGDLRKSVDRAVDLYTSRGKGHLHPSDGNDFSLDLLGLGGGKRGKWRLMFDPPVKGVLKVKDIRDPH